jgi:uncharacterized protein (TIGR01777 family)
MRVLITGGTGLIGKVLAASLSSDGHEVIVLTRNPKSDTPLPKGVQQVQWDAATSEGWGHYADGADAIVHLAGEGIADGRWTEKRKRRIYASRVNSGKAVMQAISSATTKPKVLIQASGIDYYGPHGDEVLTEGAAPGSGFLAQVCFDWEASTAEAENFGVRRAVIRSGIVLSNDGGAWPRIVLPFKLFAGGPIGSGKQYWPWIHMDDEVNAIRFLIEILIETEDAVGAYNLCAPTPLRNKEFSSTLGKVMGRPALFPVPSIALKATFGEMSTILLEGKRTIPYRLQEAGYTFKYPTAEAAFRDLT